MPFVLSVENCHVLHLAKTMEIMQGQMLVLPMMDCPIGSVCIEICSLQALTGCEGSHVRSRLHAVAYDRLQQMQSERSISLKLRFNMSLEHQAQRSGVQPVCGATSGGLPTLVAVESPTEPSVLQRYWYYGRSHSWLLQPVARKLLMAHKLETTKNCKSSALCMMLQGYARS